MEFDEKRIYLLILANNLTATNARMLFEYHIPDCQRLIEDSGGVFEKKTHEKTTYLMILCDSKVLRQVADKLLYIVVSNDITDKLVNDNDYIFNPKIMRSFDYVKFEHLFKQDYRLNTPIEVAKKRIREMGNKSRYIDYQIMYDHNEQP